MNLFFEFDKNIHLIIYKKNYILKKPQGLCDNKTPVVEFEATSLLDFGESTGSFFFYKKSHQ